MIITATMVRELRERTGVGMMECKRALEEAIGDIDKAMDILRKSGQVKAAKRANRVATEGLIVVKISSDQRLGIMLEVNCETDFVSRDRDFVDFANLVAEIGLDAKVNNLKDLLNTKNTRLNDGRSISDVCSSLVAKIGENIGIRRIDFMEMAQNQEGVIYSYIHNNGKIGALVSISKESAILGKDIAMHIAAMRPIALNFKAMPEELLAREREMAQAQLENSTKPKEIRDKIVQGKIEKFVNDSVLLGQSFVKDPSITIEKLLTANQAKVYRFSRLELGESLGTKEKPCSIDTDANDH